MHNVSAPQRPPDEAAPEAASALAYGDHPLRAKLLGEVHSRPFQPLARPAQLLHFAFMTDPEQAAADRLAVARLCGENGAPAPAPGAKHHFVRLGELALRWEQHSEFTTTTYVVEGAAAASFEGARRLAAPLIANLPQAGPLLVSAALSLTSDSADTPLEATLDGRSLVASLVARGGAVAATDFNLAPDGFVHILVRARDLSPNRAGAVAQRLLELETYRTLSLLGLPEAQRSGPRIKGVEDALGAILREMNVATDPPADHRLLDELMALAAELEADVASSSYRFGASRAYDDLVQQRLATLGEENYGDYSTFQSFLARRMAPAMATCRIVAQRQLELSEKLGRAANLLRTRVDVEIERQNRDLLHSMNERTRLQLRLQQTVEGLSVAAISYYIVGLLGYVFKGVNELGAGPEPALAMAVSVPLVVLGVALVVKRIRGAHGEE
jgi:uncharacterized membrane-anchored protein